MTSRAQSSRISRCSINSFATSEFCFKQSYLSSIMHIPSGSLVFLSVVCLVAAAPACRGGRRPSRCNVSTEILPLPMEQTTLTIPNDTRPKFITVRLSSTKFSSETVFLILSPGWNWDAKLHLQLNRRIHVSINEEGGNSPTEVSFW